MTRLSGPQLQALVWVAFKDTAKPTRRALEQVAEMELVQRPTPGHDPHYRPTAATFRELRARGLDRDRPGKKQALPTRAPEEVQAA